MMTLGFLIASHAKMIGKQGVGRRPPQEAVIERTRALMNVRLAEYEEMDKDNG